MRECWLQLVGPPALRDHTGNEVPFPTRKQLALLVYLSLETHRRGTHREQIIDLLWPDVSTERGRHSLSQGLSEIRQRLGANSVGRGQDYIALHDSMPNDVACPNLLHTVATQRPQILEGFEHVAGASFSHWVEANRERLLKHLTDSLNRAIDVHRTEGNLALVRERAAQLYDVNPASLRATSILAEHAASTGQTGRALELLEDLTVSRSLKAGDKEFETVQQLRKNIERTAATHRGTGPASTGWHLVGRDAITAQLHRTLGVGTNDSARFTLLIGKPGIGKTAILKHFALAARADGRVCLQHDSANNGSAFALVTNLARQLTSFSETGESNPAWLHALAEFAPFLRVTYPGIPESNRSLNHRNATSAAVALNGVLATVSPDAPVVVLLDNVESLDRDSHETLVALAECVSGYSLFVLGARTTPGSKGERTVMPATQAGRWEQIISVDPLSNAETSRLISMNSTSITSETLTRLAGWANGVPALAIALARNAEELVDRQSPTHALAKSWRPDPRTLADLDRHYQWFWKNGGAISEILSQIEGPIPSDVLGELSGLKRHQTTRLLRIGGEMGLLDISCNGVAFASPLFRAHAHSLISPERSAQCRLLLQRAAFETTTSHARKKTQSGTRQEGTSNETVSQRQDATETGQSAVTPAAARSPGGNMPTSGSPEAFLSRGEMAARTRNWSELRSIARCALQMYTSSNIDKVLSLSFFRMTAGDYQAAQRGFRRYVMSSGAHCKPADLARAYNGLGSAAIALGYFASAINAFTKAFTIARAEDNRAFAAAMASNLAVAYADYDFRRLAGRWFETSLQTLGDEDQSPYRATVIANYIDHTVMSGDTDTGFNVWDTVQTLLETTDDCSRGYLLCAGADLQLARGNVDEACRIAEAAQRAFGVRPGVDEHRFVMGFDSPHLARLTYLKARCAGQWNTLSNLERGWPSDSMPVSQRLELLAVFDWNQQSVSDGTSKAQRLFSKRIIRLIHGTGAVGVLRRLRAVGMLDGALQAYVA